MILESLKQQQLAANPFINAWVSASAGTGKTKVLIDRLLALLLSGVEPARILCLTFTKAAAAEMQQRLLSNLEKWVLEDEETLFETLKYLLMTNPTTDQMQRARNLYTIVLEAPHGMNISTIHGFSQGLLNRFPLEANITPHFQVIDESEATKLLEEAKRVTLANLLISEKESLAQILVTHFKDGSFQEVLEELLSNRRHLRPLMNLYKFEEEYANALCAKLSLPVNLDLLNPKLSKEYIYQYYQLNNTDRTFLLEKIKEEPSSMLAKWLESSQEEKVELFPNYAQLYLTAKGQIRKNCLYAPEAETVYRLQGALNAIELAQRSFCVFHIGREIYQQYQLLKSQRNSLDYEDLIEKTIDLLGYEDIAPWILYKLDGGIEHLLIDEAQDTNPDQWRVILALTGDYFVSNKRHRTFFVVGDLKQSIYSFQGASPKDFIRLKQWLKDKCREYQQPWHELDLKVSFRSTPEILSVVDKIVNDPLHQQDIQLQTSPCAHLSFREQCEGVVKLLPAIIRKPSVEQLKPWMIPDRYRLPETALDELCGQVSLKIQQLLSGSVILPSTGKPAEPRDILILVKQRGEIAPRLIRYLKKLKVPIGGVDKFDLQSHLAVQDLLALGEFLLLPQDELSLACVLKSPLLKMDEEDLLYLAANRKASLWQELSVRQAEKVIYQYCYDYLKDLLEIVDYVTPYDLYHQILFKKQGLERFRQHFGAEADDAVFEFLSHAFEKSQNQSVTLQQYIGEIKENGQEVKRDSADTSRNQVRLMTVHGSKGLQSPIVLILEKFQTKTKIERLLWDIDSSGICHFMLVRPSSESDTSYTLKLKETIAKVRSQEDKRLLYVALTRAQDHLYLGGYGDSKVSEASWYQLLCPYAEVDEPINFINNKGNQLTHVAESNWLKKPVVHRLKIKETEAEVANIPSAAVTRGIHIHKLFELLLDSDPTQYKLGIKAYMKLHNLTEEQINYKNILSLLQGDILAPFSRGSSVAELEIANSDGTLIRLDRVVVEEGFIKVLDYKTTENYPATASQTPQSILQQLGRYKAALRKVYPKHQIECYLLWTEGPVLHYVSEDLLINSTNTTY